MRLIDALQNKITRLAGISAENFSSKEILELRGAIIFISVTSLTSVIGVVFQYFAGHNLQILLPTILLYSAAIYFSYRLFLRKLRKRNSNIYACLVALIMFSIPVLARYNYTVNVDWLYAAQSGHINWLLITNLIAFQFLYNKRIYKFMIILVLFNIVLFYILAWLNGVEMPFHTYSNGSVNYGVMSSREIYSILMMGIVVLLSYRNIEEVEKFERLSSYQEKVIREYATEQAQMSEHLQAQYEELEAQYEEIEQMNEEMEEAQREILKSNDDLKREKGILSTTLDSVDEGIITLSASMKIETINSKACRILDTAHVNAAGADAVDIIRITKPDGAMLDITSPEFLSGAYSLNLYYSGTITVGDGSPRDIAVKSSPIMGNDAVQGYVIVIGDITELKKMKERMIQSSKLDSIGIFAGGIAHDFNNFLTSMLGCLGLVKKDSAIKEGSDSFKYLNDAETIAYRARGLTEQLLTFAKGGEPVKKVISIKEIIKNALDFILSGTSIVYDCDISEDLWHTDVDESQIMQVINNLVINSVQAMPDGGTVSVSVMNTNLQEKNRHSLPAGGYVKVEVSDCGNGIDPELIENIFDPFFTTKESGTGLGLSVAYSIIAKHGGVISAENCEKGGAKFSILIPAAGEHIDHCVDEKKGDTKFSGRVLLMDDDDMIRNIGGNLLTSLGLHVVTAANGEEAVSVYREYRKMGIHFDLVILDLTIKGGMGGRETFDIMKSIDPGIKAVVSSGYSVDSLMSGYSEYGFAGILKKPYTLEELMAILDHVLNGC